MNNTVIQTARPTLRSTLRAMCVTNWALWMDYWIDRQQRIAFERRFPIHKERHALFDWPSLALAAVLVVALVAVCVDLLSVAG